ncbi:MAG: hypothetical protein CL677_09375 [Bdellovibrionaceae bacterium]|nr:hypothetical protein [Pseudobdellovibrionaceae bacterium]|tara:strand:- start:10577 stop:11746 length:1170 start_codon:yes stop_codon:yes gene_type:complete
MIRLLLAMTIIVFVQSSFAEKDCSPKDFKCLSGSLGNDVIVSSHGVNLLKKLKKTQNLRVCENANDECFGILNGEITDKAMNAYFIPANVDSEALSKTAVLIHGLSDSPFYMRHLAMAYSAEGYNVLSVLLAGHGNPAEDGPKDLEKVSYKDWQKSVLDSLSFATKFSDTITLVGFSTGSALIVNLNAKYDLEKVQGAVVISPAIDLFESGMIDLVTLFTPDSFVAGNPKEFGKGVRYLYYPLSAADQLRALNKETHKLLKKKEISIPLMSVFAASEDAFSVGEVNQILDDNTKIYRSFLLGDPYIEVPNSLNFLQDDTDLRAEQMDSIEHALEKGLFWDHLLQDQYVEHVTPLLNSGEFVGEYEFTPYQTEIVNQIILFSEMANDVAD